MAMFVHLGLITRVLSTICYYTIASLDEATNEAAKCTMPCLVGRGHPLNFASHQDDFMPTTFFVFMQTL